MMTRTNLLHGWRTLFGILLLILSPSAWAQSEPRDEPSSASAVNLYRSAAQLQNTGVYDLAIDEWSALLKNHPQDPLGLRARYNRGICKFQLGKFAEAADDFLAVVNQPKEFDQYESALANLGLARFNQSQAVRDGADPLLQEALQSFDHLLEEFPTGSHAAIARFYRGEVLYSQGQTDQAIAAYRQFLENHPQDDHKPRAVYALAVALADQGLHAEAIASFRQFLSENPEHEFAAETQMRLGDALFAQGQYADAVAFFASAAKVAGFAHADYALLRQAAALFEQGSFVDAALHYGSLGERFPESSHVEAAQLNAGKAWLRAGEPGRAVESFARLASTDGQTASEAAHWLSRSLIQSGQPEEAWSVADKALKADPPDELRVELMIDQGDAAYEIDSRRTEALQSYANVADRHPDHPRSDWARYSAADVALSLGELDLAREHGRKLLTAYPQSEFVPAGQFILAEVDRLKGEFKAAADAFHAILREYPQHSDRQLWLNRLALVYLTGDDPRSVEQTLSPTLDAFTDPLLRSEAEYLLGTAYLRLEEFDSAVRFLARAVRTSGEPAFLEAAQLNLARAQHGAGANDAARETLRDFLSRSKGSSLMPEAVYRLGVFQAAAGDHAAAVQSWERVLAQWPQSPFAPHALYAVAAAHRQFNNLAAGKQALDRLLELYADHETANPARLQRAGLLRDLGDPAAALQDLTHYLGSATADIQQPEALYLKGLCEAELKRFDAAIAIYEDLLQTHPTFGAADRVLYELAWAYQDAGQTESSRTVFATLAERFPESELAAEAMFRLGESYYDGKDYPLAATAYAAAAALNPPPAIREKALHKHAWSKFRQEDYAAAGDQFTAQAQAFPNGELALDAAVMRGECLFQQKKYQPALAAFEQALPAVGASKSLQIIALLHAGQAAAQLEKWDRAHQLLEQCAKLFPESDYHHEVQYELAWVQYHLNAREEAYRGFTAVAEQHAGVLGARAQFMLGEIEMGRQEYDAAVRSLYRVAFGYGYPDAPEEFHPWQAAAMFDAARCLEQLGKQDAARKLYQDLLARFPSATQATHARKRLQELGT